MLAILAVALATLAPLAMAAEGQGDNDAGKQPTMAELGSKVDSIARQLGNLTATVGTLRTELGASTASVASRVNALSSTVTANHTTIVGKFAPQMAVVMTVPTSTDGANNATYYLVGDSTIAGFPAGTVAADGQFTDRTLPAGTYLFELQPPYGDNVICQRVISIRHRYRGYHGLRRANACPRMFVVVGRDNRLNGGFGIYTFTAPTAFRAQHRFSSGLTFTDDKPMASYAGAVRITKLK